MDSSSEKRTVTLQRNPLLINTVINCVLKCLSLKDIKQCRFVCQEWNSVSIKLLNKQSKVKLDSNERMTNFIEFYKVYDPLTFPFTSFHLIFSNPYWNTEEHEKAIHLFNTLREKIIILLIEDFSVINEAFFTPIPITFEELGVRIYITPLIDIAKNLVRLTITSPKSTIELKTLAKVKHISLNHCCVSLDSFENRIAPLNISLDYVTFERNEIVLQEILINDYIDFSGCSEIEIITAPSRNLFLTFDISRDIISARKVTFEGLRVINWIVTPAKVNERRLPLEKHIGSGIKQLNFSRSELNLSLLPKSLEKLTLEDITNVKNNYLPIDLPNLTCLLFQPSCNDTTDIRSRTVYDMGIVTMFRLCPKLVDMELQGLWSLTTTININVDLLPVNLKRIKLSDNKNISLVGETVFPVDILIIDPGTSANAKKFMNKIQPKILVVELHGWEADNPAHEIASFIEESRNLEKIVIKLPVTGCNRVLGFYERIFSSYVDDYDGESKCYQFINQVGKRLPREEFKMYWF